MKDLVVLACNPGALKGDYLTGTLWKRFHKDLCGTVKFCAVDSIISLLADDGNGALVLYPEDMKRVKGFDIHSTIEMFNPQKPKGLERIQKHTEALKIGIQRVFSNYDRVFVALNTEPYKMCMWAALNETQQWNKTIFYDQLAACFNREIVLSQLKKDMENFQPGMIKIPPRSTIDQKYITRWTAYRSLIPVRWQYWNDTKAREV